MFPLALLPAPTQSFKHANELTTNSLKATTPVSVSAEHSTRSFTYPAGRPGAKKSEKKKQTPGWGRLNDI